MARARKNWQQQTIEYRRKPGAWGGRRKGAGRKRGTRVQHVERPELDGRTPVHVTLRVVPELAGLRRRDRYAAVRAALARAAHREDCRIVHYSLQSNHLHLIVEPESKEALERGMIRFKTSCARRLNALAGRSGAVWADRYHARTLTSPAQVRRALVYVLNNWLRHGEYKHAPDWYVDPYSSADFFDGWTRRAPRAPAWLKPGDTPPVADATFWLLRVGWRRHGTIHPRALPGPTP